MNQDAPIVSYRSDYFIIPFFLVHESKEEDKGYIECEDLILHKWKLEELF